MPLWVCFAFSRTYTLINTVFILVASLQAWVPPSLCSPNIDVDDNVLTNLGLISRYFELNGERNITAYIAIDLQSMIEDDHAGCTRDELSYMLNNVCTVNMQLAVVFYNSQCCIIFRTKFIFIFYIKYHCTYTCILVYYGTK